MSAIVKSVIVEHSLIFFAVTETSICCVSDVTASEILVPENINMIKNDKLRKYKDYCDSLINLKVNYC